MAEPDAPSQADGPARWQPEHVLALAGDADRAAAARRVAVPSLWSGLGCDDTAVWGLFRGSGAEPYQTVVDVREPAVRCTCPSRRSPCKHGVGLMLLWAMEQVAEGAARPTFVATWLARRPERAVGAPIREADADVASIGDARGDVAPRPRTGPPAPVDPSPPPGAADRRAVERAARSAAGLLELDRWLADVVRGGLTLPSLAQRSTWEVAVARLVDAQLPSLANRLRRLSGSVGVGPGWHEAVLAELGVLHLIVAAGRRLAHLDPDRADSVRTALGWTVRQADVLARAPETDHWLVAGRSDTLEDRIVVRRSWLRGLSSRRWALVLSFAAYGQSLDGALPVGTVLHADLHRYPGRHELRCALGAVHGVPEAAVEPVTTSLAGACDDVGAVLAEIPWMERWPVTVSAAPTIERRGWSMADHTGSLPILSVATSLAPLVALSGGRPVSMTAEWTAAGLVPLAVHLTDRSVDIGPRGGFHERPWERAS